MENKPKHWYGVKGFGPGMVCAPNDEHIKQYEENTVYEEDGGEFCKPGMMHYVVEPLAVFKHYPPVVFGKKSEYAFVEALEEPITDDNKKYATKKLKIGAKIDIKGLAKAQIEFVKERCTQANTGGDWSANSGGDYSANTGGDRSANSGGDYSANRGGHWSANTGGDWSANTGGNRSANSGGDESSFDIGACAVALGGTGSKYKGGMWSVFAMPRLDKNFEPCGMYFAIVDGEKIKPDIWYTVKDGEWVEVAE